MLSVNIDTALTSHVRPALDARYSDNTLTRTHSICVYLTGKLSVPICPPSLTFANVAYQG